MAYARLIFPAGTPVLKKLKDIVRVCTGATSTAQLEFATAASSTLITLEPAGWSIADTQLEVAGTATISEYRLSSPCVDASKTKYIALASYYYPTSTIAGAVSATKSTSATTAASLYMMIGSGVSASALTNKTFAPLSVTFISTAIMSDYCCASLSSNEIYISVTNRKLIVFGAGTANNGFSSVLEFPETAFTVKYTNTPAILLSSANMISAETLTDSTRDFTANSAVGTGGGTIPLYRVAAVSNWYSPIDGIRKNRTMNDSTFGLLFVPTSPSQTADTAGNLSYPLMSFTDIRSNRFEGAHNYSKLTNFYYTYRTSTYSGFGDELTVGADTYVILSCGSATTNYRSICIKKA